MTEPHVSHVLPTNLRTTVQLQQLAEEEILMAVESENNFTDYNDTGLLALFRNFRTLDEIKKSEDTTAKVKQEKAEEKEKKILSVEAIEETAARFRKRNEEIRIRTLLLLRAQLTAEDNTEEMINKTLQIFADHSLADEGLEFIIETTTGDIQTTAKLAKEKFGQDFKREIAAGHNIGLQSREFSKEGLGTPTSLRDLYRDITGTPREPLQLFEELTNKFQYDKLAVAIKFLLHALGSDLKAKGSSIPRGELKRLLDETRSLQGILGIFRFFKSRTKLLEQLFASHNLAISSRLNFEILARIFVKLIAERYLSQEKLGKIADALGLSEEKAAQLIIFSQYIDATRQIAPRYYRTPQHRDELLQVLAQTVDELEKLLAQEEEEAKEKERQKKKKK